MNGGSSDRSPGLTELDNGDVAAASADSAKDLRLGLEAQAKRDEPARPSRARREAAKVRSLSAGEPSARSNGVASEDLLAALRAEREEIHAALASYNDRISALYAAQERAVSARETARVKVLSEQINAVDGRLDGTLARYDKSLRSFD